MLGTGSAPPSRHDLTLAGNIARQQGSIFIVDFHIPLAEGAERRSGPEAPGPSYSFSTTQISFSSILVKGQVFRLQLPFLGKGSWSSHTEEQHAIRGYLKAGARLSILSFPVASV